MRVRPSQVSPTSIRSMQAVTWSARIASNGPQTSGCGTKIKAAAAGVEIRQTSERTATSGECVGVRVCRLHSLLGSACVCRLHAPLGSVCIGKPSPTWWRLPVRLLPGLPTKRLKNYENEGPTTICERAC